MENSTLENPGLDFKSVIAQLSARKWFICFLCIVGCCVGGLMAIISPNEYEASSVIQIEERSTGVTLPTELIGSILSGEGEVSSSIKTEIHVIKSRLILQTVAQNLNLMTEITTKSLPIWGNYLERTGFIKRFRKIDELIPAEFARGDEVLKIKNISISNELVSPKLELVSSGDENFKIFFENNTYEGKVGNLIDLDGRGQILISRLSAKAGRVFYIKPLPIRSIVAKLSSGLNIKERSASRRKGTGIIDFVFKGNDPDILVPVVNSVIKTYQAKNLQRRSAEIDQSINFITKELPKIRTKLEAAQASITLFRENKSLPGELSLGTQDLLERIVNLEVKDEKLTYDIDQILKRVTPNHPDYILLKEEKNRINLKLESTKKEIFSIPKAEQTLALLTQDLESARGLELQLVERIEQLRILKASTVGNIRVLEPAEIYKKIGPDRFFPFLISIVISFIFAVIIVFLRNYFVNGIEDGRELESLGLSLFGTISRQSNILAGSKSDYYLISLKDPNAPIVEAFRGLRTALKFSLSATDKKSIMITSCAPSDGKSFLASNLAVVMSMSDQRVLLVDSDMRRGKLKNAFGIKRGSVGLSDILSSQKEFSSACYDTPSENLKFVPAGKHPPNPSELFESSRMYEFYEWAKNNFDIILFDAPPVLAVTDPIILDKYSGVNLLVVRHMITNIEQVEYALNTFTNAGVKINGTILNDFDLKNSKYGQYGYKYGYHYGGYNYNYTDSKP